MTPYILLTGATGLLGRYLLRDLLVAGVPVAVLVRPTKHQSAADRVEALMSEWDVREGRYLPRPIVLPGDLCDPDLALAANWRAWVAEHCDSVLHSAASMAFRADERGEPHRTNVDGAGHLLEFCRRVGLRRFHHISTAYICGLRNGRVLETEVDLGQPLGNVYEESKLAAEKMLRGAGSLDVLTVYRPASIVGDSQSGLTTNYHGFYLPLQLAYSFSGMIPPEVMDERFSSKLGLTGNEGKNLVPVDWLSRAIAYLVLHPEHHGRTYHMTHPHPVTVRQIQAVVQDALRRYSKRPIATTANFNEQELATFEELFYSQMLVYRSHWRDDPTFDRTYSAQALSHLPCPEMDRELLLRVARYPIENDFNAKRYVPVKRPYDIQGHLERLASASSPVAGSAHADQKVTLHVDGCDGGQWELLVRGHRVVEVRPGAASDEDGACCLSAETFAAVSRGQLNVPDAIRTTRVLLEGPPARHAVLAQVLQQVLVGTDG